MKLFLYFFFLLDLCFSSTSQNMEFMVKDGKVQSSRTIIEELIEMSIAEIQTGGEIERANTRKISLYCLKVKSNDFDNFMKELTSSIQSTLSDISRSSAEPKIKISQLVKEYKFLGEFPEFLSQGLNEDSASNPNTSYLANNLKSNDNTSDKDFLTEIKKPIKENMSNNKFGLISDDSFSDFDFTEVGNVFMDYFISEKFNPEKVNLNEKSKNAQIDKYDETKKIEKILNSGGITLRDPNIYDALTLEFEFLKRINDHLNTGSHENENTKRSFIEETGLNYNCFRKLKDLKKESWEFLQKFISKPTESYIVVSLSHLKKEMLIESFINSSLLNSISDKIFLACNVETRNISKSKQYFCEFVDKESLASEITNYIKKTQNKNRTVETKKNNYKPGNIFSPKNIKKISIKLKNMFLVAEEWEYFDNIPDFIPHQKTVANTENFKFEVFHRKKEYSKTISKSIAVLAKDEADKPKYLIYVENNNEPLKEDNVENTVDILNLLYKFYSKIRKQLNKTLVTGVYFCYSTISHLVDPLKGIHFKKEIYCSYKDFLSKLFDFNKAFEKKVRKDCPNIKEFLLYADIGRFEFIDFNDKMSKNIIYFGCFGLLKLSSFDESNNNFDEESKYVSVKTDRFLIKYEDTGKEINTFFHFEHLICQKIDLEELFILINEVFKSVFTESYVTKNRENTSQNQENRLDSGDSTSDRSSYFYPTFEKWLSTINHLDPKKKYNISYLERVFVEKYVELVLTELKKIIKETLIDLYGVTKENMENLTKIEVEKNKIIADCIALLKKELDNHEGVKTSEINIKAMNDLGQNEKIIYDNISKHVKAAQDEFFKQYENPSE